MPYSPEHGDPKSAPSTHGRHGRLAHAGVVCAKNALGRTQPSATPLRDYPRPCNHPPRLDVLLVFGSMPPGTRSLVAAPERRTRLQLDKTIARPGAHIQRHQIEPAGAIRLSSTSVTPPIKTVTDCLLQTGFADGMPIADSAISKLGLTREQLMGAVEKRAGARNGRAVRTALTTLQYADARAESGGESVARAVMIETGFAPDQLQYELTDPFDSTESMRTDFAWERQARELTLGELDGLIKYTDQTMLAGRTTAEALVAERQREAHLSLYGHPLLRFTMNEVRSAGMFAKKLQTAGIRQTALPTWLNEVDL